MTDVRKFMTWNAETKATGIRDEKSAHRAVAVAAVVSPGGVRPSDDPDGNSAAVKELGQDLAAKLRAVAEAHDLPSYWRGFVFGRRTEQTYRRDKTAFVRSFDEGVKSILVGASPIGIAGVSDGALGTALDVLPWGDHWTRSPLSSIAIRINDAPRHRELLVALASEVADVRGTSKQSSPE